jgi:thiol-disulfide isomerase/thioredoxin
MKKTLLSLFMLFAVAVKAQTPLTTAVDFTGTDVYGNQFNLFNKLDEGKYVFIDFMFTNCGPCQSTGPKLHQAFMTYGANNPNAQVYFITINRDDNNQVMINWEQTYMNPTGPYPKAFSGTQGSATAGPHNFAQLYSIGAYPTMILVAPNRQIVEQDIWPVPTAASFDPFFQNHGINPFVSGLNDQQTSFSFQVSPNPASDFLTIQTNEHNVETVRVLDMTGRVINATSGANLLNQKTIDISQLTNGVYFVELITADGKRSVSKILKN